MVIAADGGRLKLELTAQGAARIALEVAADNERGLTLHTSLGREPADTWRCARLYDDAVRLSDGRSRRGRSTLAALGAAMRLLGLSILATASVGAVATGAAARSLRSATRTSCRSVVYIGDSTSDGEALAEFVPNRGLRAPAQLSRVGVRTTHMQVSGARSIHETFEGIPNAATVAQQEVSDGFRGCWILALGTNEAADVAAGSTFGLRTRIAQMMSIIGGQPVMWVNAITLASAPQYYEETGMQAWNDDLLAACHKYPMMRVYDWAAHAKPEWFIPDGIHYTQDGYIARTRLIAHALTSAFPIRRPPSASCLVQ